MRNFFNKNSGFSLMEVLIAMVLLAGVGAMTMYSFTSSTQVNKPDASVAYNFGRGIIEKMNEFVRITDWGTAALPLSTVNPGTGGSSIQPQNSSKSLNGKTYTATYTVTSGGGADANGVDGFRKVKMTVSW